MKIFKSKTQMLLAGAVLMISIALSGCSKPGKPENDLLSSTTNKNTGSVSSVTRNVKTQHGAVGNGIADDTDEFNAAIAYVNANGGGTVYVPAGTYLINPEVSIQMKSNVILDMVDTTSRFIKVKTSDTSRYEVIEMHGISNAEVRYGKINGERLTHINLLPPTSVNEWGYGISIKGSTDCKVSYTAINNCWGDGIIISKLGTVRSLRTRLWGVVCRNNRRQGLTIGSADSVTVLQSKFKNTGHIVNSPGDTVQKGTKPMAGIDVEPDAAVAERIQIANCEISHNYGAGVELHNNDVVGSNVTKVTVQGNNIHHNGNAGWLHQPDRVKFYYNTLQNNRYNDTPQLRGNYTNVVITPNTY